jgi:2-dehydro-3-deoxy-phosphogluconate aldolase
LRKGLGSKTLDGRRAVDFRGAGAGDPAQYYKAAMIASQVHPAHVNQTFTGCGFAAGALAATGGEQTHINALVSPTGTPGKC